MKENTTPQTSPNTIQNDAEVGTHHRTWGYLVHKETDPAGIEYRLYVDQDDQEVHGNASCSGDAEADQAAEEEIISQLERGNTWAWARVTVTARFDGFEGRDHLGGCSYKDTADFVNVGMPEAERGYYVDMLTEAKSDLLSTLSRASLACRKLSGGEFTTEQRKDVLELLWESLKHDTGTGLARGNNMRRRTGWGTKTQDGLIACIERIARGDSQ